MRMNMVNMMNMMINTIIMTNEYDEFDNDISTFCILHFLSGRLVLRRASTRSERDLISERGNPIRSYNFDYVSNGYLNSEPIVLVFLFCFVQDQLLPFPP